MMTIQNIYSSSFATPVSKSAKTKSAAPEARVSADAFLPSAKTDEAQGVIGYWPKPVTATNLSTLSGLREAMEGYAEKNIAGQIKQAGYAAMGFDELAASIGMGATPEAAAAAISEDGAWGVNAVSTRLMEMAMRLSGGDVAKAETLRQAVQKGFEAVGDISTLPGVCQDTYAETMQRFDAWIAGDAAEGGEAADGAQQDAETEQTEAGSSAAAIPYADYDDPADYNDDSNVDVDEFITYAKDKLARIKDGTWVDDGRQKVMRARNIPLPPNRVKGESDESFQRKQIKYEVSHSWTTNLNAWLDHIEGWRMGESKRYLDEKSTAWVTDLMENKPAHFRQWLEQSVKINAEYAGGFDVAIVPKGFTMDDYNQWMRKDISEFL